MIAIGIYGFSFPGEKINEIESLTENKTPDGILLWLPNGKAFFTKELSLQDTLVRFWFCDKRKLLCSQKQMVSFHKTTKFCI